MIMPHDIQDIHPEVAKLWYDSCNADFTIEYLYEVLGNDGPYNGSYGTIMETRTGKHLGTYTNKEEIEQEIANFKKIRDETWREYQITTKLM